MIHLAMILALVLSQDAVKPRYTGDAEGVRDPVVAEFRVGVEIKGPQPVVNTFRSHNPFLCMEKILIRAEGESRVKSGIARTLQYDKAKVELHRFDGKTFELDYHKGRRPVDGTLDDLQRRMFLIAASGRQYTLLPDGEYCSDEHEQDHAGEAMDLLALGITRMPDQALRKGQSYEKKWRGQRRGRVWPAKFDFVQKVTVEKIEEKGGKTVATLTGELSGKVNWEANEDQDDEFRTTCRGKTKVVIEVETGRVLSSEGKGVITRTYAWIGETDARDLVELTITVEGQVTAQ